MFALMQRSDRQIIFFVLLFYIPVNNFSVMPGRVYLSWTRTKQSIKCLAQRHRAVPPMRPEHATPQTDQILTKIICLDLTMSYICFLMLYMYLLWTMKWNAQSFFLEGKAHGSKIQEERRRLIKSVSWHRLSLPVQRSILTQNNWNSQTMHNSV